MSVQEWTAVIGVAVSLVLGLGPWMLSVHAKLAVIATRLEEISRRLDELAASHDKRLAMCIEHQSRLESHAVQLAELADAVRQA